MTLGVIALLVLVGAGNLVTGYLIRYRRRSGLIAGYDAKRVPNPERLARWVGGWGMALGLECLIAALAMGARVADARLVLRVFAVAVIVSVIALFGGARRRG